MSNKTRHTAAVLILLTGFSCSCSDSATIGTDEDTTAQGGRATHRIVRLHGRTHEAEAATESSAESVADEGDSGGVAAVESVAREPVQEDAIESIDNNNGWLTITYMSGRTLGTGLGAEKDWFFAYSSHFIVVHNERNGCIVKDIHNYTLTNRTTGNMDGNCTGLRVVGDHIIIDVDTGHSTRQETYDMNLNLLRTSNVQMY